MNSENMVTHEQIKATSESFARENGNANISNKEMLIYLMHKVDNLHNCYTEQKPICEKRFATKSMLIGMFTFILGLLGSLAVMFFKHLNLF